MITDDVNLPSIIINPKPEPCIFCLEDDPMPIIYQGICNCHPSIHNTCISEWHKVKPNACPICLKGEIIINLIIIPEQTNIRMLAFACFVSCCVSICLSPFIILGIIYTFYNRSTVVNRNNSTRF